MDKNLIGRYTEVYRVGLSALNSGFTYMDSVYADPIYDHNVVIIHHVKGSKGNHVFLMSDRTPEQVINTLAQLFRSLFEDCSLHEIVGKAMKMAFDGASKEAADNLVKAFEDAFSDINPDRSIIDPDDAMNEIMSIINKKRDENE